MFCVDLVLQTADTDPAADGWLQPLVARVAALAGVGAGRLNLALVDDRTMERLHEQYCGVRGTTDVLTFDLRDSPDELLEGDLALCVDEAARQGAQHGHPARVELLLYAVHGLLHLLGHDDRDPRAAAAMHRREDELLRAAGVGAVFDRSDLRALRREVGGTPGHRVPRRGLQARNPSSRGFEKPS